MRPWPAAVAAMLLCPALVGAQTVDKGVTDVQGLLPDGLVLGAPRARPLPGTPEDAALRAFVASLLESRAFVDAVAGIAKDKPKIRQEEFLAKLSIQAFDALSAGVVLLPASDVEFILRNDLRIVSAMDVKACARAADALQLYDPAGRVDGRASTDDYARTLAITRTAYLGGLAGTVGAPLRTPEQVGEARSALLSHVATDERDITSALVANARKLTDEETCAATRAYRKAMLELAGEPGDALRRHTVVAGVRKAMAARYHTAFARTKAQVDYPQVAIEEGIEGEVRVRVWIDESGSLTDSRVMQRTFNKPSIERNGTIITMADLFDPIALAYVRAKKFDVQTKDGKPVPSVGDLTITWSLRR